MTDEKDTRTPPETQPAFETGARVEVLPEAPAQSRHMAICQSPETDPLVIMNSRYFPPKPMGDGRTIIASYEGVNFVIPTLENNALGAATEIGPGVGNLFDYCCYLLAKNNEYRGTGEINPTVLVNIDEYIELCEPGRERENDSPTKRKARKDKMRRKLNALILLLCYGGLEKVEDADEKGKKKGKTLLFFQGREFDEGKGNTLITFNPSTAELLIRSHVLKVPRAIFKLDERNPNTRPLARKLAFHYGLKRNREIGTADIISVEALLNACPGIPSISAVRAKNEVTGKLRGNGSFMDRIRDPLERDLEQLVEAGILEGWNYCGPKKAKLPDEELDPLDYETFSRLYITFKMKDEPERTNAQEGGAAKPKRSGRPKTSKGKRREA